MNLLLYAVIDAFPQHEKAREWWEEAMNSGELIGLTDPAIFGFLRISTNPRLIRPALAVEEAAGYIEEWLAEPNVRWTVPGPRHHALALGHLRSVGTGGSLTTDAQLAAIAAGNDAVVYSGDAGFARFGGLRWVNPGGAPLGKSPKPGSRHVPWGLLRRGWPRPAAGHCPGERAPRRSVSSMSLLQADAADGGVFGGAGAGVPAFAPPLGGGDDAGRHRGQAVEEGP
ncbi:MAG TPA: TA system VapC family ribonuclease toxin, partial [Trebonia sp.]|nr:TA system VapC family ribonuclease toxin [Trebonia sp.]